MLEWLSSPIDPLRAHEVGSAVAWHGRIMVFAWAILAPLAVFAARFLKIMPGQNWPQRLDNPFWWRVHWIGQTLVIGLTLLGIGLVYQVAFSGSLHGQLGLTVLFLCLVQLGLGLMRGTKGGPTALAADGSLRGDHYDMTLRRRIFEFLHKTFGYLTLFLGIVTILLGLWMANAPHWMWVMLMLWWIILLVLFLTLQRRGWAADTYEAIWGPDPSHPGNRMPHHGWGMRRRGKSLDRFSARPD